MLGRGRCPTTDVKRKHPFSSPTFEKTNMFSYPFRIQVRRCHNTHESDIMCGEIGILSVLWIAGCAREQVAGQI